MSEAMREEFERNQIESGRTDPMWLGDGFFDRETNSYHLLNVESDWIFWQEAWKAATDSAERKYAALAMQDDSPRMMAIGQNGNDGEHYE